MSVSVVIPTLNEERSIERAIASVAGADEVIVADGGSLDATRVRARAAGALVVDVSRGRGAQLREGTRWATGEWLVFLHADTRLEAGWRGALERLPAEIVGGAFRFTLDSPRPSYRALEAAVRARCRLFRLPYGDQCIFARRTSYDAAGGFAPLPLLEDVDFVSRLRRGGALAFPPVRAFTSPRRYARRGLVGATLVNWWVLGLYAAGRPPERLAEIYDRQAREVRP
jgi:rSAM/selenodomain-associated transferase 2